MRGEAIDGLAGKVRDRGPRGERKPSVRYQGPRGERGPRGQIWLAEHL